MSKTKRIIGNSFWLVAQNLVLNFASIFALAYICRKIGSGGYGQFIFGIGFIQMFSPFVNLGLRTFTVRTIAADPASFSQSASRILSVRILLALVTNLLVLAAVLLCRYDDVKTNVVLIYSVSLLFMAVTSTYGDIFQAVGKMPYFVAAQVASGVAVTLASVGAVALGFGVYGLIATYVLSASVGASVSVYLYARHLGRPALSFDLAYARESIAASLPFFWPNIVCTFAQQAGILVLAELAGDVPVGLFGAGNNLTEKLLLVSDSVCTAFFPVMVASFKESESQGILLYRRFYRYLLVLCLPISIGTGILAKPLITLIFGAGFADGAPILVVLSWCMFLKFMISLQYFTLQAVFQEKVVGQIAIYSAVIQGGSAVLFIRPWGALGLAWAIFFSSLVYFLWLAKTLQRLNFTLDSGRVWLGILAANVVMAGVTYWLRFQNLALCIAVSALVYGALILLLQVLSRNEREYLQLLLKKKLGLSAA